MSSNFKPYGTQNHIDDKFLTMVGSVGSLFNGFSRIGWGTAFDKFTFK